MSHLRRRDLLQSSASALLAGLLVTTGRPARADTPAPRAKLELQRLSVQRTDDGLMLSYEASFDLPADIESVLSKGVAVVFVAQAELLRNRWYWTDQTRAVATRRWRLAYQPLTRHWRLSFDGLSRTYARLGDALDALRRTNLWRIADPIAANDDQEHYVEFSFKLDTDELPRPLQIGLGGQTDWNVSVQRRINVPAAR